MKKMLRNSIGTIVDVSVGGVAMQAVGNSSMPQGLKDVTNIGISAGIVGRTMRRYSSGKSKKGDFF